MVQESLAKMRSDLAGLRSEKKAAAAAEDYTRAGQLKKEITAMEKQVAQTAQDLAELQSNAESGAKEDFDKLYEELQEVDDKIIGVFDRCIECSAEKEEAAQQNFEDAAAARDRFEALANQRWPLLRQKLGIIADLFVQMDEEGRREQLEYLDEEVATCEALKLG